MRRGLTLALITAAALGIPMLVLQRWVAETRGAAIALVAIWIALAGITALVVTRARPELRLPLLGTWAAVVAGTLAVGWWTGFRDREVMDDVAIASARVAGAERQRALGGTSAAQMPERADRKEAPPEQGAVELAMGTFSGEDGHAGSGTATVVEQPSGERLLTFTQFDVDPGPAVEVYLSASPGDVSDRVELGSLKGNVGDQQYEIPADADLRRYSSVVLWCTPFTVRIAVAELDT